MDSLIERSINDSEHIGQSQRRKGTFKPIQIYRCEVLIRKQPIRRSLMAQATDIYSLDIDSQKG